jgi:hypothetical protein
MPAWASTLLGVVVGGGLTYLASLRLEAQRRREDRTLRRRRALATYLGCLTNTVSYLREFPEELAPSVRERIRKVTWERSARVRMDDWLHTQRELRKALGPDPFAPLWRLVEAYSALRFEELDERVWAEVVRSINYVERIAKDRSPEARDEWRTIRLALFGAIRAAGDEVAIEASEPAEPLAAGVAVFAE